MSAVKELKDKIKAIDKAIEQSVMEPVFEYKKGWEITYKEKEIIKKAFTDPEMFIILRKALNIFTIDEVGLNLGAVAFNPIEAEVDERIKTGLNKLYTLITTDMKINKENELKAQKEQLEKDLEKALENEKAEQEKEKAKKNPYGGNH